MSVRFDIGTTDNPVWIGTTVSVTFTLTPTQDTTGWNTQVTFKKNRSDSTAIKTYLPNVVANGVWTITMTKADTQLFASQGTYVYDFERIDNGNEIVLTYGFIQMGQKVL